MEMIICDYHERECFQIEEFVFHYYQKKGCDIQIRCCKDWLEFSRQLRQKEADVVIVAQNGIEGLDIV